MPFEGNLLFVDLPGLGEAELREVEAAFADLEALRQKLILRRTYSIKRQRLTKLLKLGSLLGDQRFVVLLRYLLRQRVLPFRPASR